jgi:hypothetical protein
MDEPGNGKEPAEAVEPEAPHDAGTGSDFGRDAAERLFSLIGPRVDEVRSLLGDSTSRWRGDAVRVGEGTRSRLRDLFRELGLVTREDWDELELRVAQVEHRLGLLERAEDEKP